MADYGRPSERLPGSDRAIKLEVMSISFYQKRVNQLGRAMSAELELVGEVASELATGLVLGGVSPLPLLPSAGTLD
jgi:hypothetical protein